MKDAKYRIAFSFEGEADKKLKNDPRYVKILARTLRSIDNVLSETILSYHKCTDKDWDDFYPVNQ